MSSVRSLNILNDKDHTLEVIAEPWAYSIFLEPQSTLTVEFISDRDETPFVRISDELISFFAWSGCACRIRVNGVEQDFPWLAVPSP